MNARVDSAALDRPLGDVDARVATVDWDSVAQALDARGNAVIEHLLTSEQCTALAALYPDEAVQQALQLCHEQIFERVLESPLLSQQEDLRVCLGAMQGGFCGAVTHWSSMESYRILMPEQSPGYLKDLFCSNLRALLEILHEECSRTRASA